jgi:hypothetical protein
MIGVAWHSIILGDQQLGSRAQHGENYNIGPVTTTDTPCQTYIVAACEDHSEIYMHSSSPQMLKSELRDSAMRVCQR